MTTDHEKQIEAFGQNDEFWLFGYGSLIWKPPPFFDQRVPGYIEGYVRRFWQASEDHRGTPEQPGRVVTLIDREHWETLNDDHDAPTEKVWGAAYHIPKSKVAEVREYLDIREINGYSIQFTPFHPAPSTTATAAPATRPASPSPSPPPSPPPTTDPLSRPSASRGSITAQTTTIVTSDPTSPITCLVYIGLPSNPQFLGPQDPEALARRILECRGPSGENREYLFNLEQALGKLGRGSGDGHVSELVKLCLEIEGSA